MVLAGITRGVDGQVFNIVDDDLPSSREFLKMYKKNAGHFSSVYVPYAVFYMLCWVWEKYSKWSEGQLPPAFNRRRCSAYWKGNRYSNEKLKTMLNWKPRVHFMEAAQKYFEYARMHKGH
jgi:nucleoside-diphosphate-sugar epimerase